jgi:hypothetical protein
VLLEVPPFDLPDELEPEELDDMRSVKRLVEPRAAPRLPAAVLAAPPEVSEEDEVLLAVLEELIVSADALLELEEEVVDVELDEEELSEPPNMLPEADIAPREDPRLPP